MLNLIAAIIIATAPADTCHCPKYTVVRSNKQIHYTYKPEIKKKYSRSWVVIPAFIGGAVLYGTLDKGDTKFIVTPCPVCHQKHHGRCK